MLNIPSFETKKELIDFIVANKETLTTQKKSAIKYADGIGFPISSTSAVEYKGRITFIEKDGIIPKEVENDINQIQVKAIINTTNILDSHGDVHLKGIWNKSIKENKRIMHVQEHKSQEFDKIIASGDELKASVKDYSWKELGYDVEGKTQALVFDSTVKESRNPYMFEQYKNGYVNNHSVGMRYVKMDLAVNDKDYEKEKGLYDKHIDSIANKSDAEDAGYFWVVSEAKVVEGSAVPSGSNPITPTMSTKNEEPTLLEMIDKMDTPQTKAADSTFNIMNAISKQKF